jgi:biotin carboxyl carrier protein
MILKARLGEEEFDLEVRRHKDGTCYVVVLGGEEHHLDLTEPETNLYSALVGEHSYEAVVRLEGEKVNVDVAGRRYEIDIEDPMHALTRGGRFAMDGVQVVRSVMAGKVLEVLTEEGATVTAGDPLLVIEAMKMENEIRAPKDGTVSSIRVAPGEAVESGAELLIVE